MSLRWRAISFVVFAVSSAAVARAQAPGPTSGELTVQLTQGLDSATNPKAMSQGKVTKSTNPAVPVGSSALMGLSSDPINGGYTVVLLRLDINGQMLPAASSDVVAAPDFFNKTEERLRKPGQPQDAVKGTRVFLPQRMIVRFTLTPPKVQAAKQQNSSQPVEPPASKEWVVDKLPEIGSSGEDVMQTAATLRGQTLLNGKVSGAVLVMHCDFPTKEFPNQLPLETILGGTDEMFNAPGAPGAFVDISSFTSSQIGSSETQVNSSATNRTTGARVRFFYDAPDMEQIVNGSGQTLKLVVGSGSTAPPTAVLTFNLPVNNAPVKQVMSSCLQKSAANAKALQAKSVASCPVKDGKILNSVDLKYADTNKDVKGEMNEEDNGGLWKLAAAVKGRPARKTVLTCSYRNSGTPENSPPLENVPVPVPATARLCEFDVHRNEVHSEAFCLSVASTEIATAANGEPFGGVGQNSLTTQGNSGVASSSESNLPVGPVGPVNRLNVRGISVRMGRGQILAAGKAAGMVVLFNKPQQIQMVDPTVTTQVPGKPRSGLILLINLVNDTAVTVNIGEQGASHGEVFEDLSKKWGKPTHLPPGYDSELGAGDKATWGDKKTIYADYNPSIYSYGAQTITIYDAVALAPHPQVRKAVPM